MKATVPKLEFRLLNKMHYLFIFHTSDLMATLGPTAIET